MPSIRGTPVTPIIAVMMQPLGVDPSLQQQQASFNGYHSLESTFPGCDHEVETVFGMSCQELLQQEDSHTLPPHPKLGSNRQGPRYPSPHGYIWGLTAFMVRPLLHKLYQPVFQFPIKTN